jgi:hypothetical protein
MVNLFGNRIHVVMSSDDEDFTLDAELRIIAALQAARLVLEPHSSVWGDMEDLLADFEESGTNPEVYRAQQLSHVPYFVDYRALLPRAVFHFGTSVRLINASSWDVEPHVLNAATLATQSGSDPSVGVRQVRIRRGGNIQQPPQRTVGQLCDDAAILILSTSAGMRIVHNASDASALYTGDQLRIGRWGSDFGSSFFNNVTDDVVASATFTHGGIWPTSIVMVNANLLPFAFRWYNVNVVPRVHEPSIILYTPGSAARDVYENCTSNLCEGPSMWDSVQGCPCEIHLEGKHFDADFVHNLFPGGSMNCHNSNYSINPCDNYARVRDSFANTLLAVSALFSARGLEPERYIKVAVPHEVEMEIVAFLSSNMAKMVCPGMVCDLLSVLVEQRIYFQPRRVYYTWWSKFQIRYWRLYSHEHEKHVALFQSTSALTAITRAEEAQVSVGLQYDIRSREPGYFVPWVFAENLVPGDLVFPTTRVRGAVNLMPLVPIEFQQLLFQYLSVVVPNTLVGDAFLIEATQDALGPVAGRGRVLRYNPVITTFAVAQGRSVSCRTIGSTQLLRDCAVTFMPGPNYNFGRTFDRTHYQLERGGSDLQQLCEFVVQRNLLAISTAIQVCQDTRDRMQLWLHSADCTHVVAILNECVPGTLIGFKFVADCYSVATSGYLHRNPRMADYVSWSNEINDTDCIRIPSSSGYVSVYQIGVTIVPVPMSLELAQQSEQNFVKHNRNC